MILLFSFIVSGQPKNISDSVYYNFGYSGQSNQLSQSLLYFTQSETLDHGKFMTSTFLCIIQVSIMLQRHMKP